MLGWASSISGVSSVLERSKVLHLYALVSQDSLPGPVQLIVL